MPSMSTSRAVTLFAFLLSPAHFTVDAKPQQVRVGILGADTKNSLPSPSSPDLVSVTITWCDAPGINSSIVAVPSLARAVPLAGVLREDTGGVVKGLRCWVTMVHGLSPGQNYPYSITNDAGETLSLIHI